MAVLVLAACGGSNDNSNSTPHLITNIAVPYSASPAFSFDISYADQGKYFLADRNNKAVDVVDTATNKLVAQIPGGFAGNGATTTDSGPDGLIGLPGTSTLFVGDVIASRF
jgi:DNA-binding beta-propeller fold protein YncE